MVNFSTQNSSEAQNELGFTLLYVWSFSFFCSFECEYSWSCSPTNKLFIYNETELITRSSPINQSTLHLQQNENRKPNETFIYVLFLMCVGYRRTPMSSAVSITIFFGQEQIRMFLLLIYTSMPIKYIHCFESRRGGWHMPIVSISMKSTNLVCQCSKHDSRRIV